MLLKVNPLHATFVGEVSGVDLVELIDPDCASTSTATESLAPVREAIDEYAVVVFREQRFSNQQQLQFARQLDGELHAKTGSRTISKNRFGDEALTDISNVDATASESDTGQGGAKPSLLKTNDRRRLYSLANRLWHTDASFEFPPGRYSLLYGHVVPPVSADTQFADMRSAYDALDDAMKARLDDLVVHHSIAYSRQTLGFKFSDEEAKLLLGAIQPLVRKFDSNGRKGLYLASHAASIEGMELPEARLLIKELIEHATQDRFVYSHRWQKNDLVIYDNRATMHRATRFDDQNHLRDLRRVTTLDIPPPALSRACDS